VIHLFSHIISCKACCVEQQGIIEKRRISMTSVFGFLVLIIIVSIIVIIVDGASRVLPKNSL